MKFRNRIALFYTLFRMIVEDSRAKIKDMSEALGRTGRGQTRASTCRQLKNMYELKVSFKPRLLLKPFDGTETTAYFCRKTERKHLLQSFYELYDDPRIDYVLYLSGSYDFFLTTRSHDLNLTNLGLEVTEKSLLYERIYTIPDGWDRNFEQGVQNILKYEFVDGNLPRVTYGNLDWDEVDWKIFFSLRNNVRKEFTFVGKDAGVFSMTVKRHFEKKIVPSCTIANYFFPKGYDSYDKVFLKINTNYEKSIVSALRKLPCTSYIFPVEDSLLLCLFHEKMELVLELIRKMEETDILKDHLLFIPLIHGV